MPRKPKYREVKSECRKWFGLLLTDEQIVRFAKVHPTVKKDVAEDIFDTFVRDFFIAGVVDDLMGNKWWWPCIGDNQDYKNRFYPKFYRKAIKEGIKVTAAAGRIAKMRYVPARPGRFV